jgi:hypothetical protein
MTNSLRLEVVCKFFYTRFDKSSNISQFLNCKYSELNIGSNFKKLISIDVRKGSRDIPRYGFRIYLVSIVVGSKQNFVKFD